MKIIVQTRDCKCFSLEVNPTDDVEMIKKELFVRRGIPIDQPAIVFDGKMMVGKIGDYDIRENDILRVHLKTHWVACNES